MNKKKKQKLKEIQEIQEINQKIKELYAEAEDLQRLANELGISLANLRIKANRLGVRRKFHNDITPYQTKYCSNCDQYLPLHSFSKDRWQKGGYSFICRSCRADKRAERLKSTIEEDCKINSIIADGVEYKPSLAFNKGKATNPIIDRNGEKYLKCKGCEEIKPLSEFHKDSKNKVSGHKNYCKACINAKMKDKK